MGKVIIDDLFFLCFGVTQKDDTNRKMIICAEKAYHDLCRTIDYKYPVSFTDHHKDDPDVQKFIRAKKKFVENVENEIVRRIQDYSSRDFDEWHQELDKQIEKIAKKSTGIFDSILKVGHRQKWINMTLKYMRIMGMTEHIPDELFHVPLDDYILSAAVVKQGVKICESFSVEGLGIRRADYDIAKWSNIDSYKTYIYFQKEIRARAKTQGCSAIEWEGQAWIAEATKRNARNCIIKGKNV